MKILSVIWNITMVAVALFACTHAQTVTDVKDSLTDTQKGCAVSEAATALPPFDAYLPEIEAACGIAESAEDALLAFLTQTSTQSQIKKIQAARAKKREMQP